MRFWLGLFVLLLTGCATPVHQAIEDVRAGMDKDQVLNLAGNPKRTFREKNQDHWVYIYFTEDQQYMRIIVFDDGKVIRITRPVAKQNWERDLEGASSMEEFEKKAKEHQKKGSRNFKSIDGGPADPSKP